jgi:hypothetical protein
MRWFGDLEKAWTLMSEVCPQSKEAMRCQRLIRGRTLNAYLTRNCSPWNGTNEGTEGAVT